MILERYVLSYIVEVFSMLYCVLNGFGVDCGSMPKYGPRHWGYKWARDGHGLSDGGLE